MLNCQQHVEFYIFVNYQLFGTAHSFPYLWRSQFWLWSPVHHCSTSMTMLAKKKEYRFPVRKYIIYRMEFTKKTVLSLDIPEVYWKKLQLHDTQKLQLTQQWWKPHRKMFFANFQRTSILLKFETILVHHPLQWRE